MNAIGGKIDAEGGYMATITLNRVLTQRALHHAVAAKESTADIVWGAIEQFLKTPRRSVGTRSFVGTPFLEGARDDLTLNDETYAAVVACANSLGLSVESFVDLAVENECASVLGLDPEWKESAAK